MFEWSWGIPEHCVGYLCSHEVILELCVVQGHRLAVARSPIATINVSGRPCFSSWWSCLATWNYRVVFNKHYFTEHHAHGEEAICFIATCLFRLCALLSISALHHLKRCLWLVHISRKLMPRMRTLYSYSRSHEKCLFISNECTALNSLQVYIYGSLELVCTHI